jgi:hypothetical protein
MPHTRPYTTQKRRKRRRWYGEIFGNERRESRFWDILNNAESPPDIDEWLTAIAANKEIPPATRIYLYRLADGQPVKPALWSGDPFPEFCSFVRDRFGGGKFLCLIRRGKKMLLSGVLLIASPATSARRDSP